MDVIISQTLASVETIGHFMGMLVAYLLIGFAVFAAIVKAWRKLTISETTKRKRDNGRVEPTEMSNCQSNSTVTNCHSDKGTVSSVESQSTEREKQEVAVGQSSTATDYPNKEVISQRILHGEEQFKWFALALLVIALIAIFVARISNTPAAIHANNRNSNTITGPPRGEYGWRDILRRNVSTPSGRLVGYWEGHGTLFYWPIDRSLDYGKYTWKIESDVPVRFKVISESPSGKSLRTKEFFTLGGRSCCATVEYCIPKDGQSMTKEMFFEDGSQYLFRYSYVGSFP